MQSNTGQCFRFVTVCTRGNDERHHRRIPSPMGFAEKPRTVRSNRFLFHGNAMWFRTGRFYKTDVPVAFCFNCVR